MGARERPRSGGDRIVVDDAGELVSGATVVPSVKQCWGPGDDSLWWQEVYSARGRSDATGEFELRSLSATNEVRLMATKDHPGEAVFVAPGASDVVLKLGTRCRLAGHVLLDPSAQRR